MEQNLRSPLLLSLWSYIIFAFASGGAKFLAQVCPPFTQNNIRSVSPLAAVCKPEGASEFPGGWACKDTGCWVHPRSSGSVGPGWRVCISNRFPGDMVPLDGQGPSSGSLQPVYPCVSCESLLHDILYVKVSLPGSVGGTLETQPWEAPL